MSGAIVIDMTDPRQRDRFRAAQARGALRLHLAGIKANRHVTARKWLDVAEELTGKRFKGRQYAAAIEALTAKLAELGGGEPR